MNSGAWSRIRPSGAGLLGLAVLLALAGAGAAWWHRTSQPDYRLRRGQEALRRGDTERAEHLALRLEADGYPDHAHLLRGEAHLRQRRINQAIQEYNLISRDNEEILVEASAVYGLGLLSLKSLREAETLLRYVVLQRPDHVDAHRGLARIYHDLGARQRALGHLQRWAELDPNDGQPYRYLGLVYVAEEANLRAVQSYKEALARPLSPRLRQEVSVELAEVLSKQTEYREALELLNSCQVEEEDLQTKVLELRAECLYKLGPLEDARRLADATLADHPSSVPLLRVRARIALEEGEAAAAAKLLERALQVDASDYTCRHLLAQAYESLKRPAEAAEQRQRVEQIQDGLKELAELSQQAANKPWHGALRRRLAAVCEKLNRPDLAAMWLQAAAACPPDPPE
jgi:tetratricopeptide (TPR) repeat protein